MEKNRLNPEPVERRAGRPRAIPKTLIPKVLSLYQQGLGYRAVARELRQEGVSVDWSTIRRIVKAHPKQNPDENSHQTTSNTILTLGTWAETTSLSKVDQKAIVQP